MYKLDLILDYLNELYIDPKCELNYKNEYELLISIMLSAQTTDKRVNEVTDVLYSKYDTLEKLNDIDINELKKYLYVLGNYNKKAVFLKEITNTLSNKYNGIVPKKRKDLESLPGIGRKTCNVFLSELNISPNIAVDTHIERVSKRLGLAKDNDDVLNVEKKLKRRFDKNIWNKLHLQLLLFGRYHCKAINPACNNCKIKDICRYNRKKEIK